MSIEYASDYLSIDEVARVYARLGEFARSFGTDAMLTVMYGATADIHPALCYQPMKVGARWFDRFVSDSVNKGIIGPGVGDFIVVLPEKQEVTLCHELDIHVEAESIETVEALIAAQGFKELVGPVAFRPRG